MYIYICIYKINAHIKKSMYIFIIYIYIYIHIYMYILTYWTQNLIMRINFHAKI